MNKVQVRQAKATLSSLIEAAERGEPTTITRHGEPAAVLVSVKDAERIYPPSDTGFAEFLLAFPGGTEFDLDETPLRDIEL